MRQQIAFHTLLAWDQHGMTFRYSWSLFAWDCCSHSSSVGMVGDTQRRTKKEGRTQAGLRRTGEWHFTPVGEKEKRGGCHRRANLPWVGEKIVTGAQQTPPSSVRVMLLFSRESVVGPLFVVLVFVCVMIDASRSPLGVVLYFVSLQCQEGLHVANPKGWPLAYSTSSVVTAQFCANVLAPFLGPQFHDPKCVIKDSAAGSQLPPSPCFALCSLFVRSPSSLVV